jgi:P pilus assembly chaperone PapD
MTLTPVDELVFYPTLLTIPPKERRVIRVGLADTPTDTNERSYRIFFEELPAADPSARPAGVSVTVATKIGIPVFLEPKVAASPDPDIVDSRYAGGAYHFSLVNRGNAHVLAQDAVVLARDAAGATVVSRTLDAWYVLANGTRTFDVPMTPAECGRVHDISIVVHAPRRPDLTRSFGKPASCG